MTIKLFLQRLLAEINDCAVFLWYGIPLSASAVTAVTSHYEVVNLGESYYQLLTVTNGDDIACILPVGGSICFGKTKHHTETVLI